MHSTKLIANALLASCLLVAPAAAAGLLGGGGGSGSISTGGGSVGVDGVADVSFGSDNSGTQGDATVLGGGGSTLNVGLSSVLGSDSNLSATLPGTGNSTVDGTLGNVASTTNGLTGNGGTVGGVIGGVTGLPGGTGGLPGGSGGIGAGGIFGLGGGVYPASAGNPACTQDTRGLARLLQMRYNTSALNQWSRAAGVQVVKVQVCPQIRGTVTRAAAANASIGAMRGMVASDPLISTSLGRARVNPNQVLGVDQANGNLTVYVY